MLRIMTLNINYYGTQHGPWEVRQQLIANAIAKSQPDIIALQAVAQDPAIAEGQDQASQLASQLQGYPYHLFCPAQIHADGRVEGMAILSSLPLAISHYRELSLRPDLEDTNPRILLHARFDLPEGPFHLFNAHFSWVAEQTQDNLNEVLPYLQTFAGNAVLVGDLNTAPDSSLMAQFREEGWVDSWAERYPQEDGYTFVEGGKLCKRIDYVWVREELQARIKDVEIMADTVSEKGARASDHLGLLATLDVEV
ncbi:MAG TPA: endonuclease/exonuclease/phosphatase family protein [Leptolyngbyaceae cyanobacterium]